MKKGNILKKILGFKPELHWKMIISFAFLLICMSGVYATYLYMSAKKQIGKTSISVVSVSSGTSTTTDIARLKTFTSSDQMDVLFDIYKNKKITYQNVIKKLSGTNVDMQKSTTTQGTSSVKSVATSSKQ